MSQEIRAIERPTRVAVCSAVSFLATALLSGCQLLSNQYHDEYAATCSVTTTDAAKGELRKIAKHLSEQLGVSATLTSDRPDGAVLVMDLPLIADAPAYRPNSSGQIILSLTAYSDRRDLGVVITGSLNDAHDFTRSLRALIERELSHSACAHWSFEAGQTVLY